MSTYKCPACEVRQDMIERLDKENKRLQVELKEAQQNGMTFILKSNDYHKGQLEKAENSKKLTPIKEKAMMALFAIAICAIIASGINPAFAQAGAVIVAAAIVAFIQMIVHVFRNN